MMQHELPPTRAVEVFGGEVVDFGPPPGVSGGECAHAYVVASPKVFGGRLTREYRAFFKPTPQHIEQLNAGGFVVVGLVGETIQPFFCSTFADVEPSDRPAVPGPPVPPVVPGHGPVG